jgi:hypothetical protein
MHWVGSACGLKNLQSSKIWTMKSSDFLTSACRLCRYYSPEGRRGGHCSQLNVSVQGSWNACTLAMPVFEPKWTFQRIPVWQIEEAVVLSPLAVQSSSGG